jgi:hypothetical protein
MVFAQPNRPDAYVQLAAQSAANPPLMLEAILETWMDGIVMLNAHGKVLQANQKARELIHRLFADEGTGETIEAPIEGLLNRLPQVLRSSLEMLWDSQKIFTGQKVVLESQVQLRDQTPLRIRSRLIDSTVAADDCTPAVFVTIEEEQQSVHRVVLGDCQKFGLTAREQEVWQLRSLQRSYREIAATLFISENTVRKHVKNILAKRREGENQSIAINNQLTSINQPQSINRKLYPINL